MSLKQPPVLQAQGAKDRLLARVITLDDPTCEVLETIVAGLSCRVEETVDPCSDIVLPAFAKNFRTRLQFHHATQEEAFKKKTFEFAFKAASSAAGKNAQMETNVTSPGYDVVVNGERFSLKTEAGARTDPRYIKISKLMEARWIRECRTGEDFLRGCASILRHFTHYDRVILLRAFKVTSPFAGNRYDLVELPLSVLTLVGSLVASDFSARIEVSGTSTATVRSGGADVFRLRLDGSVEKVTLERLPVERCRFHARWIVESLVDDGD